MSRSAFKRAADVPREARLLDVSKADLLEAAWELASICNEGDGSDGVPATYRKLVETLNGARERSGLRKVRTVATASKPAADALTVMLQETDAFRALDDLAEVGRE